MMNIFSLPVCVRSTSSVFPGWTSRSGSACWRGIRGSRWSARWRLRSRSRWARSTSKRSTSGRTRGCRFADADRVVSIRNWDANALPPEGRSLHDFAIWREQVKTVDHLGAAIAFVRNLATEDGRVEPVRGAEITANAFRLLGTAPLLGRTLTEQDERPAEPPVVVISHTLWKTRFASDPGVVGRTVKLGTASRDDRRRDAGRLRLPRERAHLDAAAHGRISRSRRARVRPCRSSAAWRPARRSTMRGPSWASIGARIAAINPETHKHLRPRVTTYAKPLAEGGERARDQEHPVRR